MGDELRDDALQQDATTQGDTGFELRVGLPWMRALPLSALLDLTVAIDGIPVPADEVSIGLGARRIPLAQLGELHDHWWFVQDRLPVSGPVPVTDGEQHRVDVTMTLLLPYLNAGPDRPATLPFRFGRDLTVGATTSAGAWRDVGAASDHEPHEKETPR